MANINEEARIPVYINDEQAKSALKNLQAEAEKWRKKMYEAMASGDAKGVKEAERELKKAQRAANQLKKEAFDVNKVLQNIANSSKTDLKKALQVVEKEMDGLNRRTKEYQILANKRTQLKNELNSINAPLVQQVGLWGKLKGLLPVIGFAAVVGGIRSLVSNIISVRKEFEKYEAVLTNTLGSNNAARQEMQMLQKFAAETPFALTELTGAYVKLVNYGLKPTREEMRKYGDLASSVGKGFDQLTEAVADAVTGEFERLKEFGIKAKKEGDKITFTFKEQKTVVDNNADSIKNYITNLGEMQGVSGSMAAIAGTLGGKISNMGDAWDSLMNTMGSGSSGIMVTVIGWLTTLVNNFDGALKSIENIKRAISDDAISEGVKKGLDEINVITDKLIKGGMARTEAEKRAKELYIQSIDEQIKYANGLASSIDEIDRKKAYRMQDQLKGERDGLIAHYAKIDEIQKNREADLAKKQEEERIAAEKKQEKEQIEAAKKLKEKLNDFLEKSAEEQADEIRLYFKTVGETAFDDFIKAIENKQGKIDFSIVPDFTEEKEDLDVSTSYAIEKYRETADYQLLLNETRYKNGLIGEKEYQDNLTKITEKAEKERLDKKLSSLEKAKEFSQLGLNFVTALMDMELEKAGDNEEKKKEIRKKYAVMQFMVSASQIITDTAVAIVKALAELGPIGGAIAAGIIGATGAVQLATAYNQMAKVKSMYVGGWTGPGGKYESKGLVEVHGSEYMIPTEGTQNPGVRPFIDMMEIARRNGSLARLDLRPVVQMVQSGKQMYTGGHVSDATVSSSGSTNITQPYTPAGLSPADVQKFAEAVDKLSEYRPELVISEFERRRDSWKKTTSGGIRPKSK